MSIPSGTFQFKLNADGSGIPPVTLDANGNGSMTWTPGSDGTFTWSGSYSGDGNFLPCQAPGVADVVQNNQVASQAVITVTPNPGVPGQPQTISVAVTQA